MIEIHLTTGHRLLSAQLLPQFGFEVGTFCLTLQFEEHSGVPGDRVRIANLHAEDALMIADAINKSLLRGLLNEETQA